MLVIEKNQEGLKEEAIEPQPPKEPNAQKPPETQPEEEAIDNPSIPQEVAEEAVAAIEEPQTQTREQLKKEKAEQEDKPQHGNSRVRVRLIPIWLRLVIVILLLVFSLTAGVIVGYGVIGNGKPLDALKQSTWTHIADLINKEK